MPYVNGVRISKQEYYRLFPLNERVKTEVFEDDGLEVAEREERAALVAESAEPDAKPKRTRRNKAQMAAAALLATGVVIEDEPA
jgi:hypothetical protein